MDFFSSQESLTAIQWILRAVVAFFFMLIVAKAMGQRAISQLRFLDFVIVLMIGNIIAHPLSDEGLGLEGSMITMGVLTLFYIAGVYLSLKWPRFRELFNPTPFPLIKNGTIQYKNLNKARISVDVLLSELRKEKAEDIQKVALALWEPSGTISVFLEPQYQPVTSANLGFKTESFHLPKIIIKERKIDYNTLQQIGRDEQWLLYKLKETYDASINEVLLATVDKNGEVKIQLYNP